MATGNREAVAIQDKQSEGNDIDDAQNARKNAKEDDNGCGEHSMSNDSYSTYSDA